MENLLNYLAGIIDGEGTLGISKCKSEEHRGGFKYSPFFHITNNHIPLLLYLQEHFGGRISYLDKRCQCYNFAFSRSEMRIILPQVIPYLLVKKGQAEILLNFLDKKKESVFPLSDEQLAYFEQCFLECKRLKEIRYDYTIPREFKGMNKCKECGKDFLATSYNQRYCVYDCREKAQFRRISENKTKKRLHKIIMQKI